MITGIADVLSILAIHARAWPLLPLYRHLNRSTGPSLRSCEFIRLLGPTQRVHGTSVTHRAHLTQTCPSVERAEDPQLGPGRFQQWATAEVIPSRPQKL